MVTHRLGQIGLPQFPEVARSHVVERHDILFPLVSRAV